ncbi:MAG: endonuclease/exonuclease/phosphatase family protein, partial [gamma proteobacterium symbiont of Taylorina sp.]|nr:endonuclease/exonuclease/phosphatase family protein [gamma proteobacterium symbiont of Taylorina sp.]
MALKIASININGFRSRRKHALVKTFVLENKIDILLLQETYVDSLRLAKNIEHFLHLNGRCLWNFGKADSCGVAIFLFNDNIRIENFHADVLGRVIRLDFAVDGYSNFRIINAYFPTNSTERLDFMSNFSQYLSGAKNLILGGDFNFIMDPKLDKIGGNLAFGTVGSKAFKNIMKQIGLTDCFRYLFTDKKSVTWSRSNCAAGNKTSNYDFIGTRLDRFYISSLIKNAVTSFDNLPCVCSDHNYIVINLENHRGIDIGKSYWKLNDNLLLDDDFVTSFTFF